MRRSQSALPAADAYRAWLHPSQQRRVLSSAAVYPGYAWSSTGSTSTSTSASSSSTPLPLSFVYSSGTSSSSKQKAARSSRPFFASFYSTSNPAYPLPGSNNEIDPRGVDYSLFEAEDDTYTQHASSSNRAHDTAEVQQEGLFAASLTNTNASLSAPTQLLVRLINQQDFEAAATVLNELLTLRSPLTEPLPIFSTAALWAIRHGKKKDMLAWMRLCPGYTPGTKHLTTASSTNAATQARSIANNFRKCFLILLDSYGDDLRLLQQASMVAAQKGMWGVLQVTLAQILHFGVGRRSDSHASNPDLAWEYFHRLVLTNQSQKGMKDEGPRKAILTATAELRSLYNLGVRTLALAGRLDDAIHWAEKCSQVSNPHSPFAQILVVEPFTENLLIEELVKAGAVYVEQARVLADGLASSPARLERHRRTNVDAVIARITRETSFRANENDYPQRTASALDTAIQTCLEQGDVIAARDHLLSVLRSATRVRSSEDDLLPDFDHKSHTATFAHLPSARILSELQDTAHKLGTIAVTSSLTETDMQHPSDGEPSSDLTRMHESLTAESFLRPIRIRLSSVRGGKGLWETARLYGFVKRGKWKEAVQFYTGRAGFKLPCGGISNALVSLALDPQAVPQADRADDVEKAQVQGKHWPSTHAINLMLKAIVGACVESRDYSRLTQVYATWKEDSLPSTQSEGGLEFQQWPPSQRPTSFTFDAFVRAFARLDLEPAATSSAQKQAWGTSQAVLDVIRDMTETFCVRPSISTWTMALDCLAREGRQRWASTTEVLASAVGIRTSPLASWVGGAQDGFPEATLATYTALMRALIRVPHSDGGSMTAQAAAVRDDLLARIEHLDRAIPSAAPGGVDEEETAFWNDLLERWRATQQLAEERGDTRQKWRAEEAVRGNRGRTAEVMKEVWLLESQAAIDANEGTTS